MGLTPGEYGQHLLDLLPGGIAWRKDRSSMLRRLSEALGVELARLDGRAEALRDEADPQRTLELLPDWERVAGLPDPCVEAPQDSEARRAALVARLAGRGGQSRAFYIALAAALGFEITIQEYRPADCTSTCTASLTQGAWTHVWAVRSQIDTIRYATCLSTCTDSLASWGNDVLECALRAVKPAHTVLLFIYEDLAPPAQHLVFIYSDDSWVMQPWAEELPWEEGDGSAPYQNRIPQTPNLNALAAEGVRATKAKTTAVCSPGRASIQTGVHVHRHGIGAVNRLLHNGDLEEFGDVGYQFPLLADRLGPGVHKGFFGKLHLANDRDTEGGTGFALFKQRLGPWNRAEHVRNNHNNPPFPDGHNVSDSGYFAFRKHVLSDQGDDYEEDVIGDYSVKHWFDRALEFIVNRPPGKPTFVFIPQNTPHSPFDAPPEGTVQTAEYLSDPPTAWKRQMAMTEAFDQYLGEFLDALPPDFRANCTIVHASDNGPDHAVVNSAREDDGKEFGAIWDALLDSDEERVKASVYRFGDWCQLSWTGPQVANPGGITTAPLHIVDLFATLCEYFGVEAGPTDGVSWIGHLHRGEVFPRQHGAQFSGFFMPNGDWSAIEAAVDFWDAGTNYLVGAEVTHIGRTFLCEQNTGPSHGGPDEPGAPGTGNVWLVTGFADFSMEATIEGNPGGNDFNGRFKLIRRLGYPDRVWQLRRLDGTAVNPFELPGEEWDLPLPVGAISPVTFLQELLDQVLNGAPGPPDSIAYYGADDELGSVRQVSGGGFRIEPASGPDGVLPATDPPGDIPGRVRLDNAASVFGELILQASVPVLGAVPIHTPADHPGTLALDEDGLAPLFDFAATAGALEVGPDGLVIQDPSETAGTLAIV